MSDDWDIQPLGLVQATFTTEELAAMSAGLIRLRRDLSTKRMEWAVYSDEMSQEHVRRLDEAIRDATDTYNRINTLVSPEQGQALMGKLFRNRKPNEF
jgi:cob(I)alamin adenosyltransferase